MLYKINENPENITEKKMIKLIYKLEKKNDFINNLKASIYIFFNK